MAKLSLLIDQSLETPNSRLTFYNRFLLKTEKKSVEGKMKYIYQDIVLRNFDSSKSTVPNVYRDSIVTINDSLNERFGDISSSPVFQNLVPILNVKEWLKDDEQLSMLGEMEVANLTQHFKVLLLNASC